MKTALNHHDREPKKRPDRPEESALFHEWHVRVLALGCTRCRHFLESSLLCKAMAGEPMDVTVQQAPCPKTNDAHENST